jgi:HAD superfamily hydrolase (TIGR01509 family)
MQIRLILSDFDGTLVDTRQANSLAYCTALQEFGYHITAEEYMRHYYGMRSNEFLTHFGITDATEQERIRQRKIAIYPSFFDTLRLNEPLWGLCQQLRRQGGLVWIVSTGSRENIDNAMRHMHLTESVDGILSAYDVVHSKPDPECFLKAMELTGMTPSETLIFEDSKIGIEAARRSGASYITVDFGKWD